MDGGRESRMVPFSRKEVTLFPLEYRFALLKERSHPFKCILALGKLP
jgi:hypothetical protein